MIYFRTLWLKQKDSYSVVHFADNTIQTVPSSWLFNDTICHFPDCEDKNQLYKMILNGDEPEADWIENEVIKVFRNFGKS